MLWLMGLGVSNLKLYDFFWEGIGAEWMQLLNLISSAQRPTVTFRVATKTLHKLFTIVIFT